MGELAPLLGTGGGLGVLAVVIVYLLANNRADRGQAGEQISDAERRADAAEAREAALRSEMESERAARHRAEDREVELAREVKRLSAEVEALREQVHRLQEHLT